MAVTMSVDPRVQLVLALVVIPLVLSAAIAVRVAFDRLIGGTTGSRFALGTGASGSEVAPTTVTDGRLDFAPDRDNDETGSEPPTRSPLHVACRPASIRLGGTVSATLSTR